MVDLIFELLIMAFGWVFDKFLAFWKRSSGNDEAKEATAEMGDYPNKGRALGLAFEGGGVTAVREFEGAFYQADAQKAVLTEEHYRVRRVGYISAVSGLIAFFKIPIILFLFFLFGIILSNTRLFSVLDWEYSESFIIDFINLVGLLFQLTAVFFAVIGLMRLNKRRKQTPETLTLVDILYKALFGSSIVVVIILLGLSIFNVVEISELALKVPQIIAAIAILGPGLVAIRVRPLTRLNFLPLVSVPMLLMAVVQGNFVCDLANQAITGLWLIISGQLILDAGAVYTASEPYKGLSLQQIWKQYKVGSIIIMAILGAVCVGIGGGFGAITGMPDDVPGSYGVEVFVLLVFSIVISGPIGLLFGLLFGVMAVRRWRYGGELASWNVWIERSVKANLIAGVVIFGAFYILTKVIMDMMLAS